MSGYAEWIDVKGFRNEHVVPCRVVDANVEAGVAFCNELLVAPRAFTLVARPDTGELLLVSTGVVTLIDPYDPSEMRHERDWPRLARLQAGASK